MPNTPIAINASTSGGLVPGWKELGLEVEVGLVEVEVPGRPRAMVIAPQKEHRHLLQTFEKITTCGLTRSDRIASIMIYSTLVTRLYLSQLLVELEDPSNQEP